MLEAFTFSKWGLKLHHELMFLLTNIGMGKYMFNTFTYSPKQLLIIHKTYNNVFFCIQETFNTNITHPVFYLQNNLFEFHLQHTNLKGYFVTKRRS